MPYFRHDAKCIASTVYHNEYLIIRITKKEEETVKPMETDVIESAIVAAGGFGTYQKWDSKFAEKRHRVI